MLPGMRGTRLDEADRDAAIIDAGKWDIPTRAALARRLAEMLDPDERQEVLPKFWSLSDEKEARDFLKPIMAKIGPRIRELERELRADEQRMERHRGAIDELRDWLHEDAVLEPVTDSHLHKAISGEWIVNHRESRFDYRGVADGCQVFLIQRNWAALLENADLDQGSIRLPYDKCAFEVNVNGRRVCTLIESDGGEPLRIGQLISVRGMWLECDAKAWGEGDYTDGAIVRQISAMAICLDAEVVVSEPIRAPYRENEKRERKGLVPIYDHHVLSLARRNRPSRLSEPTPTGRHPRLHFRRGHWRRYPNHKTWIRWCLVGDATLGFSDKDYAL